MLLLLSLLLLGLLSVSLRISSRDTDGMLLLLELLLAHCLCHGELLLVQVLLLQHLLPRSPRPAWSAWPSGWSAGSTWSAGDSSGRDTHGSPGSTWPTWSAGHTGHRPHAHRWSAWSSRS